MNPTKQISYSKTITAYDSYAIRAFKVNGIDYLLKPCDEEELKMALEKFRNNLITQSINLQDTIKLLSQKYSVDYKERFAITLGSRILSISSLVKLPSFSKRVLAVALYSSLFCLDVTSSTL